MTPTQRLQRASLMLERASPELATLAQQAAAGDIEAALVHVVVTAGMIDALNGILGTPQRRPKSSPKRPAADTAAAPADAAQGADGSPASATEGVTVLPAGPVREVLVDRAELGRRRAAAWSGTVRTLPVFIVTDADGTRRLARTLLIDGEECEENVSTPDTTTSELVLIA